MPSRCERGGGYIKPALLLLVIMLGAEHVSAARKMTAAATAADVVIIGAGVSGIAAARTLVDRKPGVKVIVLEGRSRVGGRLDTRVLKDGTKIDAGASWIHGVTGRLYLYFNTSGNTTIQCI